MKAKAKKVKPTGTLLREWLVLLKQRNNQTQAPAQSQSPIHAEYMATDTEMPYVDWLEEKLEALVPNCMKTWKEEF